MKEKQQKLNPKEDEKHLKTTLLVPTLNEIESIKIIMPRIDHNWVDEIVVVDSYSSDRTPELCRAYTDRFFQRVFDNFQNQRNYAIEQATRDWVLSLDADERIGDALRQEILEAVQEPGGCDGFLIPMESYLFNRPVRHTIIDPP